MQEQRRRQLETMMANMQDQDLAAVWSFVIEFESELSKSIQHHLRAIARTELGSDRDFVSGLVLDIGMMFLTAGAWKPEGALPWVWAGRAISHLVGEAAGHRSVPVEDHQHAVSADMASPAEAAADIGLDELASEDATVQKLRLAITIVGSDRDQRVHIDYQTQIADGDPSPSHTVAETHGISPSNVRQIDRRMRCKLQRLAATETEFNELEELRWLA